MRTTRAMNATRLRQSTKGRLRKKKLCYNCTGSNNLSTVATATVQDDINVIIYIYIYIYIYIHRHVFRSSQDSSVWLGLTSREQLISPECSKYQVLSFAEMLVVWRTNRKYSVLISVLQSAHIYI